VSALDGEIISLLVEDAEAERVAAALRAHSQLRR
jgi:hypothetical protein